MTCTTLKNPGARVNAPCGGRRDPGALEADSPAFHKLCSASWAVQLARSLITNKSIPFGAVVVYAAACAWRDRGPGFGHTDDEGDFTRNAAAIPPGGWPALVGVTPQTWRRWRAEAVSANLIEIFSNGPGQLLSPMTGIEPREQFARVEIAVLFHRNLSQRARRAFVALSLFRQPNGFVSMSIRKIGADAGLERRHVQRALRELVSIGALQPVGIHRYLVIQAAPPGDSSRPSLVIRAALSRVFFKNKNQELVSRIQSRTRAKWRARTLAQSISPNFRISTRSDPAASHGSGRSRQPKPGSRKGRSSAPCSTAQGAMPHSAKLGARPGPSS